MASILHVETAGAEGKRETEEKGKRSRTGRSFLAYELFSQTGRQGTCSTLPSTSGKISFVGDSADGPEDGETERSKEKSGH